MDSMSELSSLVKLIDEEVRKGVAAIEVMKTMSETVSNTNQQVIRNLYQGRGIIDSFKALINSEYRRLPINKASEVLDSEAQTMIKYFTEMIEMYERLKTPVEQLVKTSQIVSKPCEIQSEKINTPVIPKRSDVENMISSVKESKEKINPVVPVQVSTPPIVKPQVSVIKTSTKKNHCWPHEIPMRAEMTQQDFEFNGKPKLNVDSVIVHESLPVQEKPIIETATPKEEPTLTGEPVKMITTQEAAESLGVSPATIRSKLGQLVDSGEISTKYIRKEGRMNIFPFEYLKKLTLTDKDKRSNSFFSMFQSIEDAAMHMELPVSEIREYVNTGMTKNPVNLSVIVETLSKWNHPEIINVEDVKVGDKFRFMTPNFTGLTINDRKMGDDGKERQAKKNLKTIYKDESNPILFISMSLSEYDKVIMDTFLTTEFEAVHQKKMVMTLKYTMPEVAFATQKSGEVKFNMDVLPMYPVKVWKIG